MPKLPPTIHPAVQAAVDETLRDAMSPAGAGQGAEGRRAQLRYYGMRQARLWPPFVGIFVVVLALLAMATAFEAGMAGVGLGAACVALLGVACAASQWGRFRISPAELAVLSPALRLTPIQRAYLDAKLALAEVGLPADTEAELAAGLDRMVDEEARLRGMHERGAVRAVRPDELDAERERLRSRLAATADPPAREALEASLRTCERRLESARTLALTVERIDAQLEMIGQAIGDVRDGLLRLRLAPTPAAPALELDPIRETLAHVQAHAAAIEAAVAEVQAIGRQA